MKHFRTSIIIAILAVLVYIALAGIMNLVLVRNKTAIETAMKQAINAESVEIGGFFNVPFVSIRALDVTITVVKGSTIIAPSVAIRYNVFKMAFKGLVAGVTRIDIPDVDVECSVPDLANWLNSPPSGTNAAPFDISSLSLKARVGHIAVSAPVIGQILAEAQAVNTQLAFHKGNFTVYSQLYLRARLGETINYVKAGCEFDLGLSLVSNVDGAGTVKISGIDFGGIPLLENETVRFTITNSVLADIYDSFLTNMFNRSEEGIDMTITSPFVLDYQPYQEFDLMEHILRPGNYLFLMKARFDRKDFAISAQISNTGTQRRLLNAACGNSGRAVLLKGRLETVKYGLMDVDIAFEPGKTFPEGRVELRDIAFADGLKFSGIAFCEAYSNILNVNSREFRINGGYLGTVLTRLSVETNGELRFHSPATFCNGKIDGFVAGANYDLKILGSSFPGSAIVKNITLDFFDIGRGTYNTEVHIYNDGKIFLLDAGLTGYLRGSRYVTGTLNVKDASLSISHLTFFNNNIRASASFNFNSPDKTQSYIGISGVATLSGGNSLPFSGTIHTVHSEDKTSVDFTIDDRVRLRVFREGESTAVNAYAENYSLKKFGLDGNLGLSLSIDLVSGAIRDMDVAANLSQGGRKFLVNLDTTYADNRLAVNQFALGVDSDIMYSTPNSFLWESPNRFNGKIYFDRGGSIKFEASASEINASIDLRNIYIKNFFRDGLDVLASAKATVYGELSSPDFTGSLSIVNSFNSIAALNDSGFSLKIAEITRNGGNLVFNGVTLRHRDYNADLNGFLNVTQDKTVVSAQGSISCYDLVKGDVLVMYQKLVSEESLTYRLNNMRIGAMSLGNIQGGMIHNGNDYQFYRRNEQYGLSGFYKQDGADGDWNIELLTPFAQGNYTGNVQDKTVAASLSLKADLRLLSFMNDVFKKIDGTTHINLRLTGSADDPDINGKIAFYDASVQIPSVQTAIKNKQFTIPIYDNKLVFSDQFVLQTTTGDFVLSGYADISGFKMSYIDLTLTPLYQREAALVFNFSDPGFTLKGSAIVRNVRVVGPPSSLSIAGNIVAKNTLVSIGLGGGGGDSSAQAGQSLIDRIQWNLKVTSGGNVKFTNPIVDLVVAPGQTITLLNSLGNGTFTLGGEMMISRGTFTYLGRDFQIDEGVATFSGASGDPIPYVKLMTKSRDKDQNGENIDIYLTFEGKLTTITIKDFYSIPDRNKSELYALLGFEIADQTVTNASGIDFGRQIMVNAANAGGNMLLFNPLSMTIRKTLGLDMFVIRSGVIGNFFKSYGQTNMDPLSLFEGTSVSIGKYLFSNVFLEYEFSLSRNPLSPLEFNYLHTLGVGFDFRNFYMGYTWSPIVDNTYDVNYEHRVDMMIHGTF